MTKNSKNIIVAARHNRYQPCIEQLVCALPEFQIHRITRKEQLRKNIFDELKPKFVFFIHWSWKIPSVIIQENECIIFHMTDLPFGRGGSPLQNLILMGHEDTVLSAVRATDVLDAGPVYIKRKLDLEGTAEEILSRMGSLSVNMMVDIVQKDIVPTEQVGKATQFSRLGPDAGEISELDSLEKIYNVIRMLDADDYPSAFLRLENFTIEFSKATKQEHGLVAMVKISKNK